MARGYWGGDQPHTEESKCVWGQLLCELRDLHICPSLLARDGGLELSIFFCGQWSVRNGHLQQMLAVCIKIKSVQDCIIASLVVFLLHRCIYTYTCIYIYVCAAGDSHPSLCVR